MNPEHPYYQNPNHQDPNQHGHHGGHHEHQQHQPHHDYAQPYQQPGPQYQMPQYQPPSAQYEQPSPPALPAAPSGGVNPTPVVRVLSPFGVEYVFLTVALLTSAFALTAILLLLVNGSTGFDSLAFPTSMLVVALPVFAFLFLRLKKMELIVPDLKLDASKRRSTQFTQIVAFLACFFTLVGFVFSIFANIGGSDLSVGKAALNSLCILAVAGGILAYYWRDEHIVRR